MNTFIGYSKNNIGFAGFGSDLLGNTITDTSFFGRRNRNTVENVLNLKYNFNIKMGLTFRARHYWSRVKYSQLYALMDDGYLKPSTVNIQPDNNFNIFNIDMVYTWEFAQGSFINIAWKNAGQIFDQNVNDKYYRNLNYTLDSPHDNNLSVKVIYYLDYLTFKNRKGKT
jgi:hypothetical protein